MRLLIFSNAPHCMTGYGVQTSLLSTRLVDAGHEVGILAYFGIEGGMGDHRGIPVFPRSRHPASQDWMVPLARQLQADAILSITDAWVIETHRFQGTRIAHVPWFPCDGDPMDQENARGIAGPGPAVRYPVATSEHAAAMARRHGITDMRVIPYMVDTEAYCPGDRAAGRRDWGIPESAFVVGMVAMNKLAGTTDRKRFFEQIGAFKRLHDAHPEAVLYLHTHTMAPDGLSLEAVLAWWGVPMESVLFTSGAILTLGARPETMAGLYRSFDVLLGCSGGEGAGVPLLENAACGGLSVWGEWTAMPEYAKAGWSVRADEAQPSMNGARCVWWTPDIDAIADRLERAYSCPEADRRALSEQAREGAMAHDADRVVRDLWLPALAEVERRDAALDEVTEVEIPEELRGIAGVAA